MAFISEYCTYLFNRLKIGDDGKVPCARLKGKRPTIWGVEVGENPMQTKVGQ